MKLEKFVDRLPIPQVLQPQSKSKEMTYYEVTMKEFQRDFTAICRRLGCLDITEFIPALPSKCRNTKKSQSSG